MMCCSQFKAIGETVALCSHLEGKSPTNHEGEKKSMLLKENVWVQIITRLLRHTYILDIIRSYSLVVAIYGTFSYNNNVQPFLISAVLEGYKDAKAFRKHDSKHFAFPKAGSGNGG